jgi:chromosome segregation ATPase
MATRMQELETQNQSLQMELEEAEQLAKGITTTLKNSERREHRAKDAKAQQKAEVKSLSEKISILKTRLTREEELHEALIAKNEVLHRDNTTIKQVMERKVHKLKRTVSQLGEALDAEVLLHNKTTKKFKNVHESNSKAQQENKALKKKVNRFGKRMEHA